MKHINFIVLLLLIVSAPIFADGLNAGGTGGGLPWEGALSKVVASITGPVAFAISVLAIVSAGAGLIFGNDFGMFIRVLLYISLGIGLIVSAANVLRGLFSSGATIIAEHHYVFGCLVG